MAISELVDYETGIDLHLKGPNGGGDIGVIFKVKSSECDASKSVVRQMLNRQAAAQAKGKSVPVEDIERDVIARIAACVVDWDWGGQEFTRGEGEPEFSRKNVINVLTKSGWILDQVKEFTEELENFTQK